MCSGRVGYPVFSRWQASHHERGISLLELALGLPFLCIVIAGLVDIGLSLRRAEVITNAARHGAMTAAAVSGDAPITCGQLANQATAYTVNYLQTSGLDPADWVIGPIQPLPNPSGPVVVDFIEDQGTPNEVVGKTITVSVEPSATQRGCLLCLTNYVSAVKPRAQSVFALEAPCA